MDISPPVCIAAVADRCGESVVWSAHDEAVFWVDINRFLIHRLKVPSGVLTTWFFDEPVTALTLTSRSTMMLVALASKLIFWSPSDDTRVDQGFCLPGSPLARFNDGRADPTGNFWIGSMFNNVGADGESVSGAEKLGCLYRLSPEGEVSEVLTNVGIANTVCWSPDASTFYFADTAENVIRSYKFDVESGAIKEPTNFFSEYRRGLPDGSAIDSEGYLWNCRWGGGGIARIAPNGRLDRFIEMPALNVTSCTFGGPNLTTLFVTTAANDTPLAYRLAGSLWKIETDVKGLPETCYRIGDQMPS